MDLEISLNIDAFVCTHLYMLTCVHGHTPTHTYRIYYVRALLFFRIPISTVCFFICPTFTNIWSKAKQLDQIKKKKRSEVMNEGKFNDHCQF